MQESLPVFRLDLKALAVLLGCSIGAGLSGWLLYRDLNLSGDAGKGPPMGRIERRLSKVRRKPQTSFVWSNLNDQDTLYRRDYIQTGADSSALIHLKDGAKLELRENSLIIVDDSSKLAVGFVRGGGILRTQQGDAKVSASDRGDVKVEALPVQLVQPAALSDFSTQDESSVIPFSWAWKGIKPQGAVIQVSSAPGFPRSETKQVNVGTKESAEIRLKPGRWFWRLYKDGAALGEASEFRLSMTPEARLTYPVSGQKLHTFGQQAPTQFRWTMTRASEGSELLQTQIEISTDSSFTKVLRSESALLHSESLMLTGLTSGSYWWRLKTSFKGTELLTRPQAFTISQVDRLTIRLLGPEEDGTQILKGPVHFSWNGEDASSEVEFQVEIQDDSEKTVFKASAGPASQWAWAHAAPGNYRWRIKAESRGKSIGESGWRRISLFADSPLSLREPEPGARIQFWETPSPVQFAWADDPLAQSEGYHFQLMVSPLADFSRSLTVQTTKASRAKTSRLDPSLSKNGNFYWKVQIINARGQAVKTSDTRPLFYAVYPLPAPPGAASLEGNQSQYNPFENDNRPPKIIWKPVPDVSGYELTLLRSGPGEPRKVIQRLVKAEEFLAGELDEGRYEVSIRSVDRLERRGEATTATFTVTFGDVLPPPKPESEVFQ